MNKLKKAVKADLCFALLLILGIGVYLSRIQQGGGNG